MGFLDKSIDAIAKIFLKHFPNGRIKKIEYDNINEIVLCTYSGIHQDIPIEIYCKILSFGEENHASIYFKLGFRSPCDLKAAEKFRIGSTLLFDIEINKKERYADFIYNSYSVMNPIDYLYPGSKDTGLLIEQFTADVELNLKQNYQFYISELNGEIDAM